MSLQAAKNPLFAALVGLLSMLIFCGGYEIYGRYRYHHWKTAYVNKTIWQGGLTVPSADPILLWEYRAHGLFADSEHGCTIATNRHGFRDREYVAGSRPLGVYRIAFIGDSVTLGLWVADDSTFVRLLAVKADENRLHPRVEAMNFGVDGYNALQICELLENKVLSFNPDKIVYALCLNDFDFEDASGRKILFFNKPKSFLALKLRQFYRRLSRKDYYAYHFEKNRGAVFERITEVKQLLDDRHIGLQVAIVPVFSKSNPDFSYYRLGAMHDEIARRLKTDGIPVIDLLDSFRERGLAPRACSIDEWHPNALGHRVIADALYDKAIPPHVKRGDTGLSRIDQH